MMTEEELLPFCECGKCGLRVAKKGNRFIYNHHRRGISPTAGTIVKMSAWQLGVPHTSEAQLSADEAKRGVPHTSEDQIAADKAKVGVPRSPETCAAMSAATLGIPHTSDAEIAADDTMRGGNDLVEHHYIYDNDDLSLNTVKMTRSDHTRLHTLLRKLGYLVPHINMTYLLREH